MVNNILSFENKKVRRIEYNGEWFFSVIDIVAILTNNDYQHARNYWKVLKSRLIDEGGSLDVELSNHFTRPYKILSMQLIELNIPMVEILKRTLPYDSDFADARIIAIRAIQANGGGGCTSCAFEDKEDWEQAGCCNVVCIPNPCAIKDKVETDKGQKTKTVLAVGRLHEQKGFDLLLKAWQPIEKKYPEWTLRIVGEGDKRVGLEAQIRESGLQHVCLAGRKDDISEEYTKASLFVLSSRYEGLPLALIEAMWCGVPCVSFDCPHGPKALLDEQRGWLVPNGDIEALSEQMEYAITHPEEASTRAQRAQAYAQKTYSEECIMPQWELIIENHI